jgi:hypothetical protein
MAAAEELKQVAVSKAKKERRIRKYV